MIDPREPNQIEDYLVRQIKLKQAREKMSQQAEILRDFLLVKDAELIANGLKK